MGQDLSTNFNRSPYFDDFDEMNNYLRILFRPGRAIQARELTQLQTILNNQIGNLGESIYEDGTLVFGGEVTLEELKYIKLNEDETGWDQLKELISPRSYGRNYKVNDRVLLRRGEDDEAIVTFNIGEEYSISRRNGVTPEGFFGKILTTNFDTATGAENAEFEVRRKITTKNDPGDDSDDDREDRPIFLVKGFTTRTSNDPPTVFGEYLTGDEFKEDDELVVWDENEINESISFGTLGQDFQDDSLFATISESIFFIENFFVRAYEQMVVVSKYSTDSSARLGFDINEYIVDSLDEESLLDNAAGFANENAPGADRFVIDLIANTRTIQDGSTDIENYANESFYEVARILNGDVVDRKETASINKIEDRMAKQLHDVNGNFVVRPFEISLNKKRLYYFYVDSHNRGSSTADVTIHRTDIDRDFIEDTFFWYRGIPIRITEAVDFVDNGDGTQSASFTFENLPSFVKLNEDDERIEVFDHYNYQAELSHGRAYVRGYPFENIGKVRRDIERTTSDKYTSTEEKEVLNVSFGNYLVLSETILGGKASDQIYDVGNRVFFYGDDSAETQIGQARLMQFRRSDNDRFELYFFDSRYTSVEVENIDADVSDDPKLLKSDNFESGHAGANINIDNVRYKIIEVDTDASPHEATINSNLGSDLSGATGKLSFSNRNIKSVAIDPDGDNLQLRVSETVISDKNDDGYDETQILDTEQSNKRLIFPLYNDFAVKSTENNDFRYFRHTSSQINDSEIEVDVGTNEVLHGDTSEYMIYLEDDNRYLKADEISSIDDNGKISIDSDISSGQDVSVSYPVRNLSATPISSEIIYGNDYDTEIWEYETDSDDNVDDPGSIDRSAGQVRIPPSYIKDVGTGNPFSIGLTYVTNVKAIYELADKEDESADDMKLLRDGPHKDITDRFKVDKGQFINHVDHTKLILPNGFDYPDRPILVVVDRISSSSSVSSNQRYYAPDSFSEIDYYNLPSIEADDGQSYSLRSTIDFRPRAKELDSDIDFRTWDEREDKEYRQVSTQPDAADDNIFISDITYYQPRIDNIIITSESKMKVDKGDAEDNPEPPSNRDDSITIYTISLGSYVDDTERETSIDMHDHHRFKMSDIRNIEERVQDIEEDMQSDQLEQSILSESITDKSNTELLKTGTLADGFTDQDNSDVDDDDYNASIDSDEGYMRPPYDQFDFEIEADEDSSDFTAYITDDNIILAPIEGPESFVNQPVSTRTMNVNTSGAINWTGSIKLNPEKDNWQDTIRKPKKVTDISGDKKAYDMIADNVPSRTRYGAWKKDWTSKSTRTRTRHRRKGWRNWEKQRKKSTTIRTKYSRKRVKESVKFEQKKESMGDKVVDTSIIPRMRSTPGGITFVGEEFKPRTNLYPFFEDEDIMEYIRPGIVVQVTNNSDNRDIIDDSRTKKDKTPVTVTYDNEDYTTTLLHYFRGIDYIYFHLVPDERDSDLYDVDKGESVDLSFKTWKRVWTHRRWYGGTTKRWNKVRTEYRSASGDINFKQKLDGDYRLRSDISGSVSGIFDVPEDTFDTGTNQFKLTDNVENDDEQSTTMGLVDFRAQGIEKTVQEQVVSTRVPKIQRQSIGEQSFTRKRTTSTGWKGTNPPENKSYNPLAMTYSVDGNDFPHGLFVHSIDVWFQNRDIAQPIHLEMRPTSNGVPDSQEIIPFSEVELYPDEVVIDEAPQEESYTRFKFSTPVYLEPGEYAFALKSNSNMYMVYGAVMGDNVLDRNTGLASDKVMNKQPYSGVLFKSSNASTWKSYNNENLMFRVNRCKFKTGEYQAILKTIFDNEQIRSISRYKRENNYYHFDDSDFDDVDEDGYGTSFLAYNLLLLNMQSIEGLEEIEDPSYEMITARYDESNFEATRLSYEEVVENEDHPFLRTRIIREDQQGEDLKFRSTFSTQNDQISPQIDVLKSNVVLIQNIIDRMELVPERHISIQERGSGYEVDDKFDVVPYDYDGSETSTGDSEIIGSVFVDEVNDDGGILSFRTDEDNIAEDLKDRYKLVPRSGSVNGSGAEFSIASELDPRGGITQAKHITTQLDLEEDFESQDLFVSFRAYRPSGTRIYVYYKVKSPEDSESFSSKPWNRMYEKTNSNRFSEERDQYLKLEYVTYRERSDGSVDEDTKGGAFYEVDGTQYEEFNQYQIKIVMASDTINHVPEIHNFGATALIDPIEPLGD